MQKFIPILEKTKLFFGTNSGEISAMLSCLQAREHSYKKGEYVFRQGDCVERIAVLVEGGLHIQSDDYWGRRTILNIVDVGGMFGESYVAEGRGLVMSDVLAVKDSVVIFFDVNKILSVCSSACKFHSTVVRNLFFAISEQNRGLVQKLGYLSCRSIRQKLMSYLSAEAKRHGQSSFTLPLNRQQLADYLSVDRSAMSNELCKLRDEGFIRFEKSSFTLLSGE